MIDHTIGNGCPPIEIAKKLRRASGDARALVRQKHMTMTTKDIDSKIDDADSKGRDLADKASSKIAEVAHKPVATPP